jgi:hypothetical protein
MYVIGCVQLQLYTYNLRYKVEEKLCQTYANNKLLNNIDLKERIRNRISRVTREVAFVCVLRLMGPLEHIL